MDHGQHSPPSRAAGLVAALALVASSPAHAAPPAASPATPPASSPATSPATSPASSPSPSPPASSPPSPSDAPAPAEVAPEPIAAPPPAPKDELVAPPNNVSQSAGVGGRAIASDDPEGKRARAELEGSALSDKPVDGVPDRLPPLQRGGWWSMFAAFALASTGGVFAGLAEAEEDRATRLVAAIDLETGSQSNYSDIATEYEEILSRGRRDAILARSFLAAGGVALVVGLGLFLADRVKRRPARVRAGLGGLQVRF